MAEITLDDELRLLKANAKRLQREMRNLVGDIARVADRIQQDNPNVQSEEDTTNNGTDRH